MKWMSVLPVDVKCKMSVHLQRAPHTAVWSSMKSWMWMRKRLVLMVLGLRDVSSRGFSWDSICLPSCCLSVLQITFLDGVHFVHNHVTHVVHLFLCLQSEYPFYSWYWQ